VVVEAEEAAEEVQEVVMIMAIQSAETKLEHATIVAQKIICHMIAQKRNKKATAEAEVEVEVDLEVETVVEVLVVEAAAAVRLELATTVVMKDICLMIVQNLTVNLKEVAVVEAAVVMNKKATVEVTPEIMMVVTVNQAAAEHATTVEMKDICHTIVQNLTVNLNVEVVVEAEVAMKKAMEVAVMLVEVAKHAITAERRVICLMIVQNLAVKSKEEMTVVSVEAEVEVPKLASTVEKKATSQENAHKNNKILAEAEVEEAEVEEEEEIEEENEHEVSTFQIYH